MSSSPSHRIAACWYTFSSFNVDLAFHDTASHQVALYMVDWDNNSRSQKVEVLDTNNTVLDTRSIAAFHGGQYLVWTVTGHVVLRLTNMNPSWNAVVSGVFFDTAAGSTPVDPPSPPAPPTTPTNGFVKTDTTTAGAWQGAYGSEGSIVIGDRSAPPSYVTVTPSGISPYVWGAPLSDPRGLQMASNPANRIAACWYTFGSESVDLQFHDSSMHQLAIYLVDWDNNSRSEQIDLLDGSGNILDSRQAVGFHAGEYFVWNVSGHVILRLTNTTPGWNAVLSGLFFDPSSAASTTPVTPPVTTPTSGFVTTDTATAGSWKGLYGADGAVVIGDTSTVPTYVTMTASGFGPYVWGVPVSDPRGLQMASNPANRIAACWYTGGAIAIDLSFLDTSLHQVALYLVDWDHNGRNEKVEILDASTGNVMDTRTVANFGSPEYLVWNLTGHVIIRITNTNPSSNAVMSGLFFR